MTSPSASSFHSSLTIRDIDEARLLSRRCTADIPNPTLSDVPIVLPSAAVDAVAIVSLLFLFEEADESRGGR